MPLWAFSQSYRFTRNGKKLGRLVKPLTLILFDHGRFQLSASDGRHFEITVPRRAAGYTGSREVGMALYENEKKIASLAPEAEMATTEISRIQWGDRHFHCVMGAVGSFEITENGRRIGSLTSHGFLGREKTIELPQEIPFEVQALIFLGTVQPKRTSIEA